MPGKTSSVRSNLPTLACQCLMQILIKVFVAHCGINFDKIVSKSLPAEVNNSADNLTISHICPLRRKKRLKPWIQNVCRSLKLTPVNCKII